MTKQPSYSAKDIKQPTQREHVRLRVGMYLGSNHHDGLTTALREGIDNSIDEVLGGHGNEVTVIFHTDGSAEIQDYGRGLPVDTDDAGISGIELSLGRIGSGGKFNADSYATSGGLNGIGMSATCATSSLMHAIVFRDGKQYELFFKEGLPGFFAKADDPASKFTPGSKLRVTKDPRSAAEQKKNPTGTRIRFFPDFSVFLPDSRFDVEDIKFRVKSTAFLIPKLTVIVKDFRDAANPVEDVFHFEAGITDMVETISSQSLILKPIRLQSEGTFTVNTNIMESDGTMVRKDMERVVKIDSAFAYNQDESSQIRSFVNLINTRAGGSHEAGFWLALRRVLVNYIKDTKGYLKAKEEPPTLDDVKDGFVGVLSIQFSEPTFSGQEKSQLTTPQVTPLISQAIGQALQSWMDNKRNAAQLKILCSRIVEASRIRLAAKAQKDVARKKSALETSASMPAKLVAASNNNPDEVELMLCEGDSALGGLKQARDAATTAIFPLRGKPLNAYGETLGNILKNQEWSDLIKILGAGMGKDFSVYDMNYAKIILLADSDADGSHIKALLIAGINRLMPGLIEAGRLYTAMPPLFSITTNGRNGEKYYALNDAELPALVASLEKKGKKWEKIVRHKGLGEYDVEILTEVVMDPKTRILKQITIQDTKEFDSILELTMGKNAANRREWIVNNSETLSNAEIDA